MLETMYRVAVHARMTWCGQHGLQSGSLTSTAGQPVASQAQFRQSHMLAKHAAQSRCRANVERQPPQIQLRQGRIPADWFD